MNPRAFDIGSLTVASLAGLAVASYTTSNLTHEKAMQKWQTTPGKIVAIHSHRTDQYRAEGDYSYFKVGIEYQYTVRSQSYSGTQYEFPDYGPSYGAEISLRDEPSLPTDVNYRKDFAKEIFAAYPVGKKLKVYYDPANQANSLIDINGNNIGVVWCPAAIYFAFLIVGLYMRWSKRDAFNSQVRKSMIASKREIGSNVR